MLPIALLLASMLAPAQADSVSSSATCNPLSATACPADTALATGISVDFTEESDYFSVYSTPDKVSYDDDGLTLTLAERFDNPSLKSNFYIMFGKIEVLLKTANGTGVISSFYLQSDDLDEIDLEWFGGDGYEMQSNYFSKGNTSTYDRGGYHKMEDPRLDYHNYTLDWTKDATTWYIDGEAVRTLDSNAADGYPQSPMYVMMGIWAGGDSSNAAGTIEWAGGSTDYTEAPFSMHVKKLVVVDYSSGTEYKYGDQSGDWTSIEAVHGSVNGRQDTGDEEFAALVAGESDPASSDDASSSSAHTLTKSTGFSSVLHLGGSGSVNTAKRSATETTKTNKKAGNSKKSATDTTLTTKSTSKKSKTESSSSDVGSSSSIQSVSNTNGAGQVFSNGRLTTIASIVPVALFALILL